MYRPLAAVPAFCVALWATAAAADRIDGDWCSPDDSRHLSIDGPTILPPEGGSLNGAYTRHSFSYTAPDGAAKPGARIDMRLLNEETMQMRVEAGAAETWHRCNLNA